jgi:polyisoprenoid-binding protein YceI
MTRIALIIKLTSLFLLIGVTLSAQRYFTREGKVFFNDTAPTSPEKIEANAKAGVLVVDIATGAIEMAVLLKGFLFEKALMQEHFNENYVESTKYPKATFKGKLEKPEAVTLTKDGIYVANVSGTMDLHGVTKPLTTTATFTVKGGKIVATANFPLILTDYKIEIPSLVANKLAKQAAVTITANLALLK